MQSFQQYLFSSLQSSYEVGIVILIVKIGKLRLREITESDWQPQEINPRTNSQFHSLSVTPCLNTISLTAGWPPTLKQDTQASIQKSYCIQGFFLQHFPMNSLYIAQLLGYTLGCQNKVKNFRKNFLIWDYHIWLFIEVLPFCTC